MTIDGFRPQHRAAFTGFVPDAARRFYAAITWLSRRLSVEVSGIENVPRGRALLVANHAFGWDVVFPMATIWNVQHRPVWALGEHAWWKVPFLRRLAAATGTVDGTPANLDRLLQRDQLVLVLPGGLREAVKPRELRYRLLWGHRYGFVRAAIRNQTPLVPLAAIGADDAFELIGDAYRRGERWLHRGSLPIPRSRRLLPIPRMVQLRYVFGEPIPPRFGADEAENEAAVKSLRHEIEGALHELIETELARRAGIETE
ncbi:MAG TPA: 1-acyl-sn-glycerol-3-phosphate acyltransferase [Polyangiaceae bacterium]|nr:1-acyl-sn-glycerol-3-phosphate acyltransferase [Polyangiaceae bacterium]